MNIVCVIPARFGSTRFPGKPLALLGGKTIIERVYEQAGKAHTINAVFVATDDSRIAGTVRAFGGNAIMTSPECASGTDRIAEAVRDLSADIVVNVQGDEPLISPVTIDMTVQALQESPECTVSTPAVELHDHEDFNSPHIVKVVFDPKGHALYFSRSPIPSPVRRDDLTGTAPLYGYKHLGLYVYRREALEGFSTMLPSRLETIEKLEQLRFLEHGYRIRVVVVEEDSAGIDTPEELQALERMMSGNR